MVVQTWGPIILACVRLRQETLEFKTSMDCIAKIQSPKQIISNREGVRRGWEPQETGKAFFLIRAGTIALET